MEMTICPRPDWVRDLPTYGPVWGLAIAVILTGLLVDVALRAAIGTFAWMGTAASQMARCKVVGLRDYPIRTIILEEGTKMPINTPPRTPICAACGCSLVRLHIGKEEAVARRYNGREYLFCCQGCVDIFAVDTKKLLQEYERRIDEIAVCPACLGEIPLGSIVEVEYDGDVFGFCRCPHCKQSFEQDPGRLVKRLLW